MKLPMYMKSGKDNKTIIVKWYGVLYLKLRYFILSHVISCVHGKTDKSTYYLGICNRFQGFGFTVSFDNPVCMDDYWLIEARFLWIKFWYTRNY